MPPGDKSAYTDKQKRSAGASENARKQKGVTRPEAQARPRPTVDKLHGGGRKMGPGRGKVPFGPVGGLGRKTNLARSS